jgi:multidrug efflux pump subunit AcrB
LPDYHTDAGHHADPYDKPLYHWLRKVIVLSVDHRKTVVLGTVGLLVLSVFGMIGPVEKQFFPSSDRPEVLISVYLPQGTAIANTDAVAQKIEKAIVQLPEVKTLSAYIGAGAPRFFISANPEQPDPAFAKIIAVTYDVKSREKLIALLENQIQAGDYAGARVHVSRLLFGPPVRWPVSFRIYGPDTNELRRIGYAARTIMAQNPNVADINLDWDERAPVLHINTDPQRLRAMGLTPRDISQQLQFQLDGVAVTEVRQDIRSVEVRARGLRDPAGLQSAIEFKTQDGRKVPLAQVGQVEVKYEEPVIKRLNREPFLALQSDVIGAQPPDVTMAVWQALAPLRASLPEGYRISIAGSIEQSGKADASIQKLQPLMLGLMLIFVMLQMRTFSGTFIVFATAPLGLIGAVLAMLIFRQPFGFVALLGLIGLAGILMRNTLILTQQVTENFAEGLVAEEAVVQAAVHRARPVVLTALAAALAFIPLTFDSFWGPLAYVLIGGVLVGTIITLIFVPALYAWWYKLGSGAKLG